MKENSVDIKRVYWYSLPIMMLGGPLAIILYQVCHGISYKKVLYDNPSLLLIFILSIVVIIDLYLEINDVNLFSKPK